MFLRLYPSEKLLYIPIEERHLNKLSSIFHRSQPTDNEKSSSSSRTFNMTLSPKSLAGPGYIILNGIRVMNIIGFIAVVTASVGMLVKTTTNSHFFFFDAVSHVITTIVGMFLLVSELSLFTNYYARNWPLLSADHGFVALAVTMLILGTNILGNLNKDANSQASLGMAFWQVTIASGIITFILGWINLVASYIFRDCKQGITARQVRTHGAVAVSKTPMPGSSNGSMYTPSAPELARSYMNPDSPHKSSNPFRILTSPRQEPILPSYHASSTPYPKGDPESPSSKYSRTTNGHKKGGVMSVFLGRKRQSVGPQLPVNVSMPEREMQISAPIGVNPQFAHLVPQRPDSALHPSRTGESETQRWRAQ